MGVDSVRTIRGGKVTHLNVRGTTFVGLVAVRKLGEEVDRVVAANVEVKGMVG